MRTRFCGNVVAGGSCAAVAVLWRNSLVCVFEGLCRKNTLAETVIMSLNLMIRLHNDESIEKVSIDQLDRNVSFNRRNIFTSTDHVWLIFIDFKTFFNSIGHHV